MPIRIDELTTTIDVEDDDRLRRIVREEIERERRERDRRERGGGDPTDPSAGSRVEV